MRGAYHFARPQKGRDPKAEAHEMLQRIKDSGGLEDGDLVPTLDIEAFGAAGRLTPAQTVAWARGFVDEVEARIGRKPLIYTGAFWRDEMGNPTRRPGLPPVARWPSSSTEQFIPRAFRQGRSPSTSSPRLAPARASRATSDLNSLYPGSHTALTTSGSQYAMPPRTFTLTKPHMTGDDVRSFQTSSTRASPAGRSTASSSPTATTAVRPATPRRQVSARSASTMRPSTASRRTCAHRGPPPRAPTATRRSSAPRAARSAPTGPS